MNANLRRSSGFTLLEVMVVVVIVAIFAAIAIPSYQNFVRRSAAAQAQQEVQRIATLLEQAKSRNFNYIGFNLNPNPTVVPSGATGGAIRYNITVMDNGVIPEKQLNALDAGGQDYIIRALSTDNKNFSFILSSTGLRCKKVGTTLANCTGAETW